MSAQAPSIDQVRHAWDGVADGFDQHVTPHSMVFGERALRRLELGPGTRVLDVGAGSGALAIPAARTGAEVVAVDIAPTMIERLDARARNEGLNLQARVGDGEALDFDDDTFDASVSMNGVSVFPDLHGGLRELVRVTRRGGQVLVIAFGPLSKAEFVAFPMGARAAVVAGFEPPQADPPMPAFRLADPRRLRNVLEQAGMHDVRVDVVDWEMAFASVDRLLDMPLPGTPIAGQRMAGMTDQQFTDARQVLDGMLRERSGGAPGAVLHTELNVAIGTV